MGALLMAIVSQKAIKHSFFARKAEISGEMHCSI